METLKASKPIQYRALRTPIPSEEQRDKVQSIKTALESYSVTGHFSMLYMAMERMEELYELVKRDSNR